MKASNAKPAMSIQLPSPTPLMVKAVPASMVRIASMAVRGQGLGSGMK